MSHDPRTSEQTEHGSLTGQGARDLGSAPGLPRSVPDPVADELSDQQFAGRRAGVGQRKPSGLL